MGSVHRPVPGGLWAIARQCPLGRYWLVVWSCGVRRDSIVRGRGHEVRPSESEEQRFRGDRTGSRSKEDQGSKNKEMRSEEARKTKSQRGTRTTPILGFDVGQLEQSGGDAQSVEVTTDRNMEASGKGDKGGKAIKSIDKIKARLPNDFSMAIANKFALLEEVEEMNHIELEYGETIMEKARVSSDNLRELRTGKIIFISRKMDN
ncbi:unnamed protein product [Dovyalis caffra]|uniref:Uncharacterized protein n=1 Tax=Dovyalis caffra TaxID=77055 RepID=A0AAV1SGF2_9ROSI|nr:unnamed protein product [Dovyalis caffra]